MPSSKHDMMVPLTNPAAPPTTATSSIGKPPVGGGGHRFPASFLLSPPRTAAPEAQLKVKCVDSSNARAMSPANSNPFHAGRRRALRRRAPANPQQATTAPGARILKIGEEIDDAGAAELADNFDRTQTAAKATQARPRAGDTAPRDRTGTATAPPPHRPSSPQPSWRDGLSNTVGLVVCTARRRRAPPPPPPRPSRPRAAALPPPQLSQPRPGVPSGVHPKCTKSGRGCERGRCHSRAATLYVSRATMKRELRNLAAAEPLYDIPAAAQSSADAVSVASLSELAPCQAGQPGQPGRLQAHAHPTGSGRCRWH